MRKAIKAQVYINKKIKDESHGKAICNKIDKNIEGWPIDYRSYQSEFDNKSIMVFDIYIECDTYKDCDYFYKMMKQAIKDCSYESPHQVAKVKCEVIA